MWESSGDRQSRAVFGAYVKERRQLLPAQTSDLGSYPRLPQRVGRRVTQEEFAEAIGTSRAWYAMIECGTAVTISPRLLERIADALHLPGDERMVLLHLAYPEVLATAS